MKRIIGWIKSKWLEWSFNFAVKVAKRNGLMINRIVIVGKTEYLVSNDGQYRKLARIKGLP